MDTTTLLCFPHAGAGRLFYQRWRPLFRGVADFVVVQYPHREQRMNVPMPVSLSELVEQIFAEYHDRLSCDYAFWGHSMGSVVAYELMKVTQARLGTTPLVFFSSGSSAPSDSTFRDSVELSTNEGIDRILRSYGGVDERTLNDRRFMDYFRPIITSDLRMLATYRDPEPSPLPCPLVLFQGDDDVVNVDSWKRYTPSAIDLSYYSGGHFFITEHSSEIADEMSRQMTTAKSSRSKLPPPAHATTART